MVGGLSGQRMLIGLLIGIIVLVVLVLKTKIHAFLALIMSAVIIGLVGGMPMVNVTLENGKTLGIINSITTGFGGTLGSIGIIIGFGVMMGQIFERTGAAKRMAQTFLKLFGKGREEEALGITGFLVSIPIFCDSGFVILAPIAKAISKVTKKISDFTGSRTGGRSRYHPYAGTSDTGAVGRLRYFRSRCGKIPPVWYRDCDSDGDCLYHLRKMGWKKDLSDS